MSDSSEELENWKYCLHEASMWKCAHITKSLRWVRIEACEFPTYEGFPNIHTFFNEFEIKLLEQHWFWLWMWP